MSDDLASDAERGEEKEEDEVEIVSALSTMALEQKLESLRDQSNKHSQLLTQRLATSQSGQNLLHIGSSLSSLPPDLHSLLTHLHPVLSAAETTEKQYLGNLQKLVAAANEIRLEQRRVEHSLECADLYEDLCSAEQHVSVRKRNILQVDATDGGKDGQGELEERRIDLDRLRTRLSPNLVSKGILDHAASLERAANTALCLVRDLHTSSEQVSHLSSTLKNTDVPSLKTPLDHDTERAQFIMKLAPRIRKLEADCIQALSMRLEAALKQIQREREDGANVDDSQKADLTIHHHEVSNL
jgi:conserved oligomeric Golgi complex subunit 2